MNQLPALLRTQPEARKERGAFQGVNTAILTGSFRLSLDGQCAESQVKDKMAELESPTREA